MRVQYTILLQGIVGGWLNIWYSTVLQGIVGGWLNIWYNIISVIFFFIFNIPSVGTDWLNYVLPLSCLLVLPLLLVVKVGLLLLPTTKNIGSKGYLIQMRIYYI